MFRPLYEKISNFIKNLEGMSLSLWQIVLLFYLSSFIRGFLEVIVNAENFNRVTGPIDLFFHYPLWFIGVFLSAVVIVSTFTKEKISKIGGMVAVFSFVVIIPIITDLLLGSGGSAEYIFILGTPGELVKSFLSFFGATEGGFPGATAGLRAEGVLVICFLVFYIFYKTKSILKSVLAPALLYCVVFLFAITPVVLHTCYNIFTNNNSEINTHTTQNFLFVDEVVSSVTINRTFLSDVKEKVSPYPSNVRSTTSFTLSVFFLVIDVMLGAVVFYLYDKNKFWAVVKNTRPLRAVYYYIFVFGGFFWGVTLSGRFFVNSAFDLASVIAVILSGTFAGLFAVWENDEVDIEIDKISNAESVARPLAKGILSLKEWSDIKFLFLFVSLNFAFLCGFYQFVFTLLFVAIYHIYSVPPLRLKRFLGASSLLVAFNALVVVWMGVFIAAGTENFSDLATARSLGILFAIFLADNIKNIKDIAGDKKHGIMTLPVVFGEKNGKLVIGSMAFLAMLLVPIIFFMNVYSFVIGVFFGAVLFLIITRERFEEKYVFISYFIFAIVIFCEELIRIYGFPKI